MRQYFRVATKQIAWSDWHCMIRQAKEEYPEECCGVFLKSVAYPEASLEWQPCHNIQNLMHRNTPYYFPRDACSAYVIDPTQWRAIHRRIEVGEVELAILYHSHNDAPAYFSEEDYRCAVWNESPLFPMATYLVLSVIEGQFDHWKAFEWEVDSKSLLQVDQGSLLEE
ncbi:Mov34/MPN/PAD-1 family protein [bacterium]|nr:Mov34/MPN/PAD-1 family protein [bacterium]